MEEALTLIRTLQQANARWNQIEKEYEDNVDQICDEITSGTEQLMRIMKIPKNKEDAVEDILCEKITPEEALERIKEIRVYRCLDE